MKYSKASANIECLVLRIWWQLNRRQWCCQGIRGEQRRRTRWGSLAARTIVKPQSHCLVATCCNVLLRPTLVDSCHLYLAQSSLPYKLALHHVVGTINRDLYGAWTEKLREKVSDQADPSSIGGGWPQPPVQGFHVVLNMTWTFQIFFTREPTNSTPHRPIRTKSDLIARLAVVNSWDTTQEQQTKAIAVIQSHTVL
jgi:hypothetical protein